MPYQRFEDVPVWQKAAQLYEATEELLENRDFHGTRGFKDQLDRAALLVSNKLIYIARGSAGEVRSMLCLKGRRAEKCSSFGSSNFRFEINRGELLSAVARVVQVAAKLRHQRSGTFDQAIAAI
jgi:hypothetical protein